MAKQINVLLIDDLDGSTATETVEFGLDGTVFEIDLNSKNAAKLRQALDPFVSKAERKSGKQRNGVARGKGTSASNGNGGAKRASDRLAAIRAWARETGMTISDRGRIPAEVEKAFDEAHAK